MMLEQVLYNLKADMSDMNIQETDASVLKDYEDVEQTNINVSVVKLRQTLQGLRYDVRELIRQHFQSLY
jgi:hypothetical protein